MGFQSYRLGDLVNPEGPAVLVGRVDNSASLQVGREVRGESMGAIPEVQVVGPLVDLEADLPVGLEVGHPVGPEVGHLMDPEVCHLEDQVVDSFHSGRQEVDPEEVDRSDRHRNLGQNKTPG